MDNCTTYIAMDTHKKQHAVALLDRKTGEVRQFSARNNIKEIAKMVKRIAREAPADLKFCYAAMVNLKRICHQLEKFLTRHGYVFNAGKQWTQKHHQWLRDLEFDQDDLREVFELYYVEWQHCAQRLDMLDNRLEQLPSGRNIEKRSPCCAVSRASRP